MLYLPASVASVYLPALSVVAESLPARTVTPAIGAPDRSVTVPVTVLDGLLNASISQMVGALVVSVINMRSPAVWIALGKRTVKTALFGMPPLTAVQASPSAT